MGATPSKVFAQPGSYAMDNENIVAPQDPTPQIAPQQFVSMNAYDGTGTAAPATPTKPIGNGRGRGKFFGDQELDGLGGGNPRKSTFPPNFPPPVKKPHLPPGGSATAYKIDSGY